LTLKREKSNKQRAEELALKMGQSICTENGGVFSSSFFPGALSVAFLPLKIYTGQFEIQKKSLKILGDTGTLVQICGCNTLQL
jgi:hypothetical protein